MSRIGSSDGGPLEFEWKHIPGFTALQILAEIQKMMNEMQCEPEQFTGRIIFTLMYNDILWVFFFEKRIYVLRIP